MVGDLICCRAIDGISPCWSRLDGCVPHSPLQYYCSTTAVLLQHYCGTTAVLLRYYCGTTACGTTAVLLRGSSGTAAPTQQLGVTAMQARTVRRAALARCHVVIVLCTLRQDFKCADEWCFGKMCRGGNGVTAAAVVTLAHPGSRRQPPM
jgi:hypothetical protein